MKPAWIIFAAALACSACNEPAPSGGAAGDATGAAATALNDEQLEAAELPVPADFEEAAIKEINEETLDDQVSALEAEINGDNE